VVAPSRAEPGCLDIHAFRSTRDARLFYIHSRWKDEASITPSTSPAPSRSADRSGRGLVVQALTRCQV